MATLGEKLIFKFKDKFVKIGDKGKKKLSRKELGKLFDQNMWDKMASCPKDINNFKSAQLQMGAFLKIQK